MGLRRMQAAGSRKQDLLEMLAHDDDGAGALGDDVENRISG